MMALARGLEPRFMHVNGVPPSPGWLSQIKLGGPSGNRTPSVGMQSRRAPVITNGPWCPAPDSNRPPALFGRVQSPDLLTRRIGADTGSRRPATSLATKPTAVIICPQIGGRWIELNFLPQRDAGYSRATGPPVLICSAHMW